MSQNKKAAAFRNKNHMQAQTQHNTDNLTQLGQMMMPIALKVFEMEKTIERLQRQLSETKSTAKIAEYKAQALSELSTIPADVIRSTILGLQRKDFQVQSDADDRVRGLTIAEGPANEGQIALIEGKVFDSEGKELTDEEIVGSKPELGKDDLFKGVDQFIIGKKPGETGTAKFTVNEKEYSLSFLLIGLRDRPAPAQEQTEEGNSEEAQVNQ